MLTYNFKKAIYKFHLVKFVRKLYNFTFKPYLNV